MKLNCTLQFISHFFSKLEIFFFKFKFKMTRDCLLKALKIIIKIFLILQQYLLWSQPKCKIILLSPAAYSQISSWLVVGKRIQYLLQKLFSVYIGYQSILEAKYNNIKLQSRFLQSSVLRNDRPQRSGSSRTKLPICSLMTRQRVASAADAPRPV